MHLLLLLKAMRAVHEGRIGDAGVYKAAALTAAPHAGPLNQVLLLADPLPDFADLSSASVPAGSLGQAYAAFLAKHGITPLTLSTSVRREVAQLNVLAVRYVLVHDLFHVLLGFGIDRPGELAVWSFVSEQRYSPSYERAAKLANWLYPLAEPSARRELHRQRAEAMQMARDVPCLIAQPFERYWDQPLESVRDRFGILTPHQPPCQA